MASAVELDRAQALTDELIDWLHQEAPVDMFVARLAQVQALPESVTDKSRQVETVRMAMAVRNRLDLWQQRESGMLAVIESARDLSGRLDLQELLRAIVARARKLLGSQMGYLSAFDASLGAFHVLASDGTVALATGDMMARSDVGIVSVVMSTRLPFSTQDYLHDQRFPHDARLDTTFRDEGICAVIGVPLLWEGEVIGLLFVADRYHRSHTAQNISILSTLATHAAVALKNAMAFEQAGAALISAQAARAEVEQHASRMQAAAEAHERMTGLLAKGATLATISQAVAGLMNGCILVLDEAREVIGRGVAPGYDGGVAERYAPHTDDSNALAQALSSSRQIGRSVVAFEADGEICRINAVIGGDDALGSILLFTHEAPDEVAVRTFERSASIVGVVLLSRERTEASQGRDLSSLLRALLSPRQDDVDLLCERAQRFGLDLAQSSSLLLVDMDEPNAATVARRLRTGKHLPGSVFDEIDGVLVVLCATTRAQDVRRVVSQLASESHASGYRGIVSRPGAQVREWPALYVSLRRSLPVLRRIGIEGQIVGQGEMALYSTLFETQDRASLQAFLEATIGALTAHDQKRGSGLALTLLSYFDCNQNAKLAAHKLGIHVNTVRQRLATIEELLGHWGNATRALEIHIALRLWSLGGDGDG
jgi:hypothetical protein